MSNALKSEPVMQVDIPHAGAIEAMRPASGAGGRGRISADSFRLLTAKLRAAPVPVIAPVNHVPPTVAAFAETLAEPPRLVPEPAPTGSGEPPQAAEPLPEASPESAAEAAPAVELQSVTQLILPEFQPIAWDVHPQAGEAQEQAASEPEAEAGPAMETEAPAAPETVSQFDLPSAGENGFSSQAESEPERPEALPVESSPVADAVERFEAAPQLFEAEAQEPPVAGTPQWPPADVEPVHEAEPGAEPEAPVPFEAVPEGEPAHSAEAGIASQPEPEPEPEPAPPEELVAGEVPVAAGFDQQAEELPGHGEPVQAQVPALPVCEEPAAEIPAVEMAKPGPAATAPGEAAPDGEAAPAAQPSAIAGRVVDAMLKTISSAIYAKPSATERAAFLREIANLMESEGSAGMDFTPAAPAADAMQAPDLHPQRIAAPAAPAEAGPIGETLASRMGPGAALLKVKVEEDDPFTRPVLPPRLAEPLPLETADADAESGGLALNLLDMMTSGAGAALPHERTLAADTLLRILPRIPVKQLLAVVDRVAIMEVPPALLVAKLIRDSRPEVVGPLLERCSNISDQDLIAAAPGADAPKLRMIARRRVLSTVLSDYLISTGEPGVLLTLIRNPGAALSHDAFFKLAEHAIQHHALLAPLATRADLPPPVAFELFWHVPQELRRFIFSRFLTDSETLNKILRITLATHSGDGGELSGEGKFPTREQIDAAIDQAAGFHLDAASVMLAEIGGIDKFTALRILSDREGEPLTVLMKAMGYPRAKFGEVLERLRHSDAGVLSPERNPEELQAIFDGLSFNKARILLTYWDWFVRKAGPYAPHN